MDINTMTSAQLKELSRQVKEREASERRVRRDAYEALKNATAQDIKASLNTLVGQVRSFRTFIEGEMATFFEIMKEYGELRSEEQGTYSLIVGDFKAERALNKRKAFDERADIAAAKLVQFLNGWIKGRAGGDTDPMYKLAMLMIRRNSQGELDYKSVGKLYEMEVDFCNDEYTAIMNLFRESNRVASTCYYYNFYERRGDGVWRKVEPSFNRL